MSVTWESMKATCLLDSMPDKNRKIEIGTRFKQAITGPESTSILVIAPEIAVLTLHIEQMGSEIDL